MSPRAPRYIPQYTQEINDYKEGIRLSKIALKHLNNAQREANLIGKKSVFIAGLLPSIIGGSAQRVDHQVINVLHDASRDINSVSHEINSISSATEAAITYYERKIEELYELEDAARREHHAYYESDY